MDLLGLPLLLPPSWLDEGHPASRNGDVTWDGDDAHGGGATKAIVAHCAVSPEGGLKSRGEP